METRWRGQCFDTTASGATEDRGSDDKVGCRCECIFKIVYIMERIIIVMSGL